MKFLQKAVLILVFVGLSGFARAESKAAKTSLDMKVVGVLVVDGGHDRRSSAMIGLSGGHVETYYPGETIGGQSDLKLVSVGRDEIEFLNHGKLESAPVKHFPEGHASSSSTASSSPSTPPEPKDRDTVTPFQPSTPSAPHRRPPHIPTKKNRDDAPAADAPPPDPADGSTTDR